MSCYPMNEDKKPVFNMFSCVTEPVNQNEICQIYFIGKGETGFLVWLSRSTKMKFVKFIL